MVALVTLHHAFLTPGFHWEGPGGSAKLCLQTLLRGGGDAFSLFSTLINPHPHRWVFLRAGNKASFASCVSPRRNTEQYAPLQARGCDGEPTGKQSIWWKTTLLGQKRT